MNLLVKVVELQKLEEQAGAVTYTYTRGEEVPDPDFGYISGVMNAAPSMLAALAHIQPGDERKLDFCIEIMETSYVREEFVEPLRRLQAMCQEAEKDE